MLKYVSAALRPVWRNKSGATAIEYAMITVLIVLVLIAAMLSIGTSVSGFFNAAGNGL